METQTGISQASKHNPHFGKGHQYFTSKIDGFEPKPADEYTKEEWMENIYLHQEENIALKDYIAFMDKRCWNSNTYEHCRVGVEKIEALRNDEDAAKRFIEKRWDEANKNKIMDEIDVLLIEPANLNDGEAIQRSGMKP